MFSPAVQAVTVNVSAVEVLGPACVDEVKCSTGKFVFFAILSVASVVHVGTGGVVDLASEVAVTVVESIGLVVKVGPTVIGPVLEATDSVLEVRDSTLTSIWLSVP